MGEKCPHRKVTKRRDSNKQSLRTTSQLKADHAVYDALQKPDAETKALPMDGDLPGMGQYYCLHCNRYFENVKVRDEHFKTKHKMRKKKKRGQRATGADKSGRGLRQLSMRVYQKVESKGMTTYNEVAEEVVAEFSDIGNTGVASPAQQQCYENNIRRRVYDALNVIQAMGIISKDKDTKEIQWKGRARTSLSDIEELMAELVDLKGRAEKKYAYLQELEEQYIGLQNLIQHNEHLYSSGNVPNGGVALPFILVQTRPHATVEVEISEDMQLVHFDFNSTSYELHDDNYVLKAMKFCD